VSGKLAWNGRMASPTPLLPPPVCGAGAWSSAAAEMAIAPAVADAPRNHRRVVVEKSENMTVSR
jgi:hypothetical protein